MTAQIEPDNTLGAERSILRSNASGDSIEGGAIRGQNLFHSFLQFNVRENQSVKFANPNGIVNILSRVTGEDVSNINGILGVSGNANLFLINPNGIVFGKHSNVNINGAFVASTANHLIFPDGSRFSATNPNAPPLLTINVPIGLQVLQYDTQQPANITNNGNLIIGKVSRDTGGNLRLEGNNLILSGGTVINNGSLTALSGKVLLEGVSGNIFVQGTVDTSGGDSVERIFIDNGGDVTLTANGNIILQPDSRIVANGLLGGKIYLESQTGNIYIISSNLTSQSFGGQQNFPGKDIEVMARAGAISIHNGAILSTSSQNSGQANAGNILIQAKNHVSFQGSAINSSIAPESTQASKAKGNAGDITIEAGSVSFTNNNSLTANTNGTGNAGNISVHSTDNNVIFGYLHPQEIQATSLATSTAGGTGNAGNITITVARGSLFIRNQSSLSTITRGQGRGGIISIEALNGNVELTNGAFLNVSQDPERPKLEGGDGGNISIEAKSVTLSNKAQIFSRTLGQGNAGNISIAANDVLIIDGASLNSSVGEIGKGKVEPLAKGTGGDITITTNSLRMTNSAQLLSNTVAKGDAGNIIIRADIVDLEGASLNSGVGVTSNNIPIPNATGNGGEIALNARSLSLDNEAKIEASTSGRGNAGSIGVQGDSVALNNNSQISTSVNEDAIGRGGEINLNARSLFLNNAQITASTSGRGNAGSIKVENAEQVNLTNDSSISTSVNRGAVGRGGEINLNTRSLSLDNAQITASTSGRGDAGSIIVNGNTFEAKNGGQLRTTTTSGSDAGNITLNQRDNITLSGNQTGLFANTELNSSGKGGSIAANSRNMTISNGASVTVSSQGTGEGGNIKVQTDSLTLDRGTISATTDSTEGGNIILSIKDLLLLRNGSRITAQAGQTGNGGDLTIDAGIIFAVPQEDNDIIANASEGNGGNINIRTQGLFNLEEREAVPGNRTNDIDASSEFGIDGEVRIDAPNVDPSRRLVRLPNLTITPEVLQGCRAVTQQGASRFISTGRGGLPPGIDEISDRTVWEDMRTPTLSAENPSESDSVESSNSPKPTQIIEAQGWLLGSDGKIVLTAKASNVTPTQIGDSSVGCRISQ
ncbi:MAG: filamentous hemagglutinin N-terminal domain-containing protein [Hydrococcus sp. CRU_1_1]|nr:filamentous hemagglutinin N-terminal domain-containing protein [Hydrococcus sp. CRU_1_1]